MANKIEIDESLWKNIVKAMGSGKDEEVLKVYKKIREQYDVKGTPL